MMYHWQNLMSVLMFPLDGMSDVLLTTLCLRNFVRHNVSYGTRRRNPRWSFG
uniref:ORF10 n=1 Tax=Porcine adenovirus 5 TaxID=45370 RepID=Q99HW7_9ADEN|nr:ORF10 [Porcine adenovirus 5]